MLERRVLRLQGSILPIQRFEASMLSALRCTSRSFALPFVAITICLSAFQAPAQTAPTLILPYTISTIAGGGSTTTAGSACFPGSTLKATDAFGDGCPATQAVFSADFRGGVATDPVGNVYIADTTNNLIRKIDARSGVISVFVGGNTICAGAVDKLGDGCPITQTGGFNNPRGIGSDPYGNILIAGYSDQLVHLVCNAVSPLCTAAQIGTMRVAAGCTTGKTSFGTSGSGGDGTNATPTGTCSATVAAVNQPRGANADRYGNIFIGDTGNSRFRMVAGPVVPGLTNPLIAILQLNPANSGLTAAIAAGNIYALVGGAQFTVPASGAPCSTGSSSTALDGSGDGCPFFNTSQTATGGFTQGITADSFGDAIFNDANGTGRVRVVYAGGANNPMTKIITVNNPSVTAPQVGYVYSIAGGGSTTLSGSPILGSSANLDGSIFRVSTDGNGDIFVGDNTQILFIDASTGYIRKIAASSTACAGANAAGDGCPATQASFSGSNSVLTPAIDNLGNLYFDDGTHATIRKISAASFAPALIGTSATPSLFVHAAAGATSISTTLAANADFSLGAQNCTTNASDQTYDCVIPVTFTPTQIGLRDGPLQIQTSPSGTGTTINGSLTSIATGANLVFDPTAPATPTANTLGSSAPTSIAVDGHGNVYTVNGSAQIVQIGPTAPTISTPISAALGGVPNQIAVGTDGSVYAATPGSASIAKLVLNGASYTQQAITNGAIASARAIAVDANGNVYVADNTTRAIIRFSQTTGLSTTLTATALNNPVALALDGVGNVLVADKDAGVVYRLPVAGLATGLPPTVTVAGTISPVGVAADQAGDVYIADASTNSVMEVPISGTQATVAAGFTALNGVAVDGAGSVYVSDANRPGVVQISRNNFSFGFGTDISEVLSGSITNSGNAGSTGFSQGDSSDFQLTGAGSTCNPAASSVLPGAACIIAASFTPTPTGTGTVPNAITFLPAGSTGSLMLTGSKTGTQVTTTTTIGGQSPAAPVYSAPGAAVTFTVTVVPSAGTAVGNVSAAVDGGVAAVYPLNASGVATVTLTGLTAGSHTVTASYPTQSGVVGSAATPVTFSVAKAATTVTWTPTTLTQQFSQAIGTGVFNATAGGVAGAFVYSATPSGGTAMAVDAASYLPIGSYSFAVSFTPNDSVDYLPSSATVTSYTVAKAATTAAVGASTNVVAADGSGNFNSVAAAVAALPATGGTIYIAPGTYSGQFTISYPNVSLRGLGGDATKVVMTAEGGAFSAPFPPGVSAGNNGAQGDQGSATVVVDKSTIGGVTYVPNLFYAENLSIVNTYDTDATNSNTLAVVNGTCTANQPAANNFSLYNAGTLCASQALALWIRSDKAVLNNVRLTSLQDTLYAGSQGCGTTCVPARQYYWKGYITGDVDYLFGDAAAVFDQTSIFTTYHGLTATGTETIEAQQKLRQTGSAADYLSGYIFNSVNLTSQSSGMTQLYFGRPYGQYSTFIMLNTTVDQVNPLGWIEFSGDTNLPTSTYAEFNTMGAGGATVAQRETISIRPGSLTAAQAAQYAPLTFLGTPSPDSWDPTQGLAAGVNGFVPTGSKLTVNLGQSVTILARPLTPGGGAIPTGSYTLMDGATVLKSGALDASGNAYLTTGQLPAGLHNISLNYGGDANFNASSTATAFALTVVGTQTAVSVATANPVYNSPVNVTVAVTPSAPGNALTGTVSLVVDGGAAVTMPLTGAAANFTLTGLKGGVHSLVATYSGDGNGNNASTGTASVTVSPLSLKVTAPTLTIAYGGAIPAYTPTYAGFVGTDAAATSLAGTPALTTTPVTPVSAGIYPIVASVGTLTSTNYSFVFVSGLLMITRATTTTTLASSNTSPGQNIPVTLTATVKSTASGTPTGSVSFFSGTTLLSTITLPATGIATLSTGLATLGASTITAVYSGDGNYLTSTSNAVGETTVVSGFAVSATPANLTIRSGASGTLTLMLTPTGNFQASATFACSSLPAASTCSFSPSTVNFAGNNVAVTTQLTIATNVQTSSLEPLKRAQSSVRLAGILLFPGLLFAGSIAARRKSLRGSGLLIALVALGSLLLAAGCGGSSSPTTTTMQTTPAGTYPIVVSASAVNGGAAVTQQVTATVVVTQ